MNWGRIDEYREMKPLICQGVKIRDNSDDHRWRFPEGSTIEPERCGG